MYYLFNSLRWLWFDKEFCRNHVLAEFAIGVQFNPLALILGVEATPCVSHETCLVRLILFPGLIVGFEFVYIDTTNLPKL